MNKNKCINRLKKSLNKKDRKKALISQHTKGQTRKGKRTSERPTRPKRAQPNPAYPFVEFSAVHIIWRRRFLSLAVVRGAVTERRPSRRRRTRWGELSCNSASGYGKRDYTCSKACGGSGDGGGRGAGGGARCNDRLWRQPHMASGLWSIFPLKADFVTQLWQILWLLIPIMIIMIISSWVTAD